jgi:hypothetical protein
VHLLIRLQGRPFTALSVSCTIYEALWSQWPGCGFSLTLTLTLTLFHTPSHCPSIAARPRSPSHSTCRHTQVGFFEVVVLPLMATFATRFRAARPMLEGAISNYHYWQDRAAASAQLPKLPNTSGPLSKLPHSGALSKLLAANISDKGGSGSERGSRGSK